MELAGIVCRPSVASACRNITLKVHYPVVGGLAPAIQLAHYFAIASGSGLRAVRGPAPTCPLSIDARLVNLTARRDAAPARQEVLAWHAVCCSSSEWSQELVAFRQRELSRADGVHINIRLEHERLYCPVLIGATGGQPRGVGCRW